MKSILTVNLHGNHIHEIQLEIGQEYVAGRGKTCDIILDGVKGISRQHMKFVHDGDKWTVQLLSKYGALIYAGENCEQIDLDGDASFAAPPFEFKFVLDTAEPEAPEEEASPFEVPNDEPTGKSKRPKTNQFSAGTENALSPIDDSQGAFQPGSMKNEADNEAQPPVSEKIETSQQEEKVDPTFMGNMESTDAGANHLDVYLEARYTSGREETFRLEGNLWVAGRDPSCEIFLRDDHVSRKHFELTQTNDGFFVTDLGSSNGTYINKKKLKPHTPTPIQSGDRIKIKKMRVKFKVVDQQFQANLQNIDEGKFLVPVAAQSGGHNPALQPYGNEPAQNPYNMPMMYEGPAVERIEHTEFSLLKISSWEKKHKFRAVILVVLGLFVFLLMEDPQEKDMASSCKPGEENCPMDDGPSRLSPEEQQKLRVDYSLAQQLMRQKKYSLCIAKVDEIHTIAQPYKESNKFLKTCEVGLELEREKAQREQLEISRKENLAKVNAIIKDCRKQLPYFQTLEALEGCLQPAYEIDPGSPEYEPLRIYISQKQEAEEARKQTAEYRNQQIREGQAMFMRAKKVFDSKKLKPAMSKLQSYLGSTYPDPKNNKAKARKMLKEARQEFDRIVSVELKKCLQLADQAKWKEADLSCNQVLKQDKNNQKAKVTKSEMRKQLSKKMKEIYENSTIEENFGNIEAANELWGKILAEDFPGGTVYYQRAKRKRQKYGL